jgi:hypothetical protein
VDELFLVSISILVLAESLATRLKRTYCPENSFVNC